MNRIQEHARILGISPNSTAAAWSFLRDNPCPIELPHEQIGAFEQEAAAGWLDQAVASYAQGMDLLRQMPADAASRYIGDVRLLGLQAVQAIGEVFELILLSGTRSWVAALTIIRNAIVDSVRALAKGANEAIRAFWGVPPIIFPIALAVGLLTGAALIAYLASGPVGMVVAKGAAKGLGRGLPSF